MSAVSVRFKGQRRFNQLVRSRPAAVAAGAADANLESAEEMARIVRQDIPVDTGKGRRSVAVTKGGRMTPDLPGGSVRIPLHAAAVTAGNKKAWYLHFLEYGTIDLPARPFFWPAWRKQRRRHRRRAREKLRLAA